MMRQHSWILFLVPCLVFAQDQTMADGKSKAEKAAEVAIRKDALKIMADYGGADHKLSKQEYGAYLQTQMIKRFEKDSLPKGMPATIEEYEYMEQLLFIRHDDSEFPLDPKERLQRFKEDNEAKGSIPASRLFGYSPYLKDLFQKALDHSWARICPGSCLVTGEQLARAFIEEQGRHKKLADSITIGLQKLESTSEDAVKAVFLKAWFHEMDADHSDFVDFFEFHKAMESYDDKQTFLDFKKIAGTDFFLDDSEFTLERVTKTKNLDDAWYYRWNQVDDKSEVFDQPATWKVEDLQRGWAEYKKREAEVKAEKAVAEAPRGYIPGKGLVLTKTRLYDKESKKYILAHQKQEFFKNNEAPVSVVMRIIQDFETPGADAKGASFNIIRDAGDSNQINEWDGALRFDVLNPKWLKNRSEISLAFGGDWQRTDTKEKVKDARYYLAASLWRDHQGVLLGSSTLTLAPIYHENTLWVEEAVKDEAGNEIKDEAGKTVKKTVARYTETLEGLIEWAPSWGSYTKWWASDQWTSKEGASLVWNTRFAYVYKNIREQPLQADPDKLLKDQGFLRSRANLAIRFNNGWCRLDYGFTYHQSLEGKVADARFHDLSFKLVLLGDMRRSVQDERIALTLSYKNGIANPLAPKDIERTMLGLSVKF